MSSLGLPTVKTFLYSSSTSCLSSPWLLLGSAESSQVMQNEHVFSSPPGCQLPEEEGSSVATEPLCSCPGHRWGSLPRKGAPGLHLLPKTSDGERQRWNIKDAPSLSLLRALSLSHTHLHTHWENRILGKNTAWKEEKPFS